MTGSQEEQWLDQLQSHKPPRVSWFISLIISISCILTAHAFVCFRAEMQLWFSWLCVRVKTLVKTNLVMHTSNWLLIFLFPVDLNFTLGRFKISRYFLAFVSGCAGFMLVGDSLVRIRLCFYPIIYGHPLTVKLADSVTFRFENVLPAKKSHLTCGWPSHI